MKEIIITSLLFVAFILSLSGCTNTKIKGTNNNKGSSYAFNEKEENNTTESKVNNMISEDVEIYEISRDVFFDFLESNNVGDMKSKASRCHIYSKDGENYITSAVTLFKLTTGFVDFVSNKASMQKYLAENGVNGDVEDLVVFDAPHIPHTIWVKTSTETVFLTINEDNYFAEENVYKLYRREEYHEKYKVTNARLTVNGYDVTNCKTIKMYYGYADLPFTAICSALGADVKWGNKTQAIIEFKGKVYELDATEKILCEKNSHSNLLTLICGGGPYYMYYSDGEFFLDSSTLSIVLLGMGQNVNINCNAENDTIDIVLK